VARSVEESLRLVDRIVGRCVREPEFARVVIADPDTALREYELTDDELEDFRVLSEGDREATLSGWAALGAAIDSHRPPH
jgi:hypothetical protein